MAADLTVPTAGLAATLAATATLSATLASAGPTLAAQLQCSAVVNAQLGTPITLATSLIARVTLTANLSVFTAHGLRRAGPFGTSAPPDSVRPRQHSENEHGLQIITPPVAPVLPLDEIHLQLKLGLAPGDTHPEDPLFLRALAAARRLAEQHANRAIGEQTVELVMDSFPPGTSAIGKMPWTPVLSVSSVTYVADSERRVR